MCFGIKPAHPSLLARAQPLQGRFIWTRRQERVLPGSTLPFQQHGAKKGQQPCSVPPLQPTHHSPSLAVVCRGQGALRNSFPFIRKLEKRRLLHNSFLTLCLSREGTKRPYWNERVMALVQETPPQCSPMHCPWHGDKWQHKIPQQGWVR